MVAELSCSLPVAQVLGLPLHLAENYADWLLTRLQQRQGTHVVTLNAEMAMQAEQKATLAEIIHQADLVVPDGAGVVLYLRLRGKQIPRCPGIELAEELLRRSPQALSTSGDVPSIFFYGGQPGVAEQAVKTWQEQVPTLAIAGHQHGFLTPEEQEQFFQTLETIQPAIILVGLGVPRQEFWIQTHRHRCPNSIWIGVGGSLDIWAGTKTRAPEWLRNNNLEWTYRLYKEPWRWRRMLALPQFAWKAIRGE